MARIRSIHPGLFTDEDYMSLSAYGMAAWPGLWVEADDNGIFEWKPLTLKARLLPCAQVDMADILDGYLTRGMIRRFEVDGRGYGAIRNFRKFQRPEKPKAWHPIPDDMRSFVGLSPTAPQQFAEQSPTPTRKSPQMEDGGGRMEKKEARANAPPDAIWFEGQALRLNRRDFEAWEHRFSLAYPDFWDELSRIDGKLASQGLSGSKAYLKAEGWLNAGRNQRAPPARPLSAVSA